MPKRGKQASKNSKPNKSKQRSARKPPRRAPPSRTGISGSSGGLGSLLGSVAKTGLKFLGRSILGVGDYKITSNTLLGSAGVPAFGLDEVRYRRKEYLGDISTLLKDFKVANFPLNPGCSVTFPWLSKIAANYEQWKPHGIVFQFVSTSATAISSTDPALGKILMATEYDVSQPLFNSSRAMLATLFSNYGKPAEDLVHAIECDRTKSLSDVLFVRTGGLPQGTNLQLYDLANFQVATEGLPSATNIGGIWVSYDISFMKPKLSTIAGEPAMDHWYILDSAVSKGNQIIHNASIGGSLTYDSKAQTYTYTFPPGVTNNTYMLFISWYNISGAPVSTGAGGLYDLSSLNGCQLVSMYKVTSVGSGVTNTKSVGTPNNTCTNSYGVKVTALGTDTASFRFNGPVSIPAEYSQFEVMLMQCSMASSVQPYIDTD